MSYLMHFEKKMVHLFCSKSWRSESSDNSFYMCNNFLNYIITAIENEANIKNEIISLEKQILISKTCQVL